MHLISLYQQSRIVKPISKENRHPIVERDTPAGQGKMIKEQNLGRERDLQRELAGNRLRESKPNNIQAVCSHNINVCKSVINLVQLYITDVNKQEDKQ